MPARRLRSRTSAPVERATRVAAVALVLVPFLCAALPGHAAARDAGMSAAPPPVRAEISIPYPNAAMYLHRGIYASFTGGGANSQVRDSAAGAPAWGDAVFQWQGEMGYFYTEWFSAGAGFRINAGAPSDSIQTVENRYFLVARLHRSWPRAAAFVGMRVGVDDVNFSLVPRDSLSLEERISESETGIGVAAGGGWKVTRHIGLTFGQRADLSFVRQTARGPSRSVNLLTQPGLALDLVRLHPPLGRNVKAFYLLSELQLGQSFSEFGPMTRQFAWITGLSIAF